jgi:hypothetical protein
MAVLDAAQVLDTVQLNPEAAVELPDAAGVTHVLPRRATHPDVTRHV